MGKYQRMGRMPWSIWGVVLRNWSTLLCFEVFYRVMGFEILFPWLRYLLSLLPGLVGEPYLGQKNLASILHHPTALLLLLFIVLLAALFVCIEIVGLFAYCERGWRRESLTVWNLIKETALRMRSLLSPKRLAVLLLFPPMTLSVFALTSGYLKNVKVPEFILEFFAGNPALSLLFSVVVLLSNLLLLTYLYGFPSLLFGEETFLGSWRASFRLLRREKRRTAREIAACLLLLTLTAAVLILAVVVFTALRVKCFTPPEEARGQFQFFITSAEQFWTAFSGAFLSAFLCAVMVSLYHERRGEERPGRVKRKRAWPSTVLRLAIVAGTLVLVTFFSETEAGGWRIYSRELHTEVVAHRAGAGFAPENTLAALDRAVEDGAHMAEIDVQQLGDGTLIVMHDTGFQRTAGVDMPVWEASYEDVERMDAGSFFASSFAGEPVPTLDQMLRAARGRIHLMIELKSTGHETDLVEQTLDLIKRNGMERQCVVASMEMDLLERVKALDPEMETVYISMLLLTDQYDLKDIDAYSVETGSLSVGMVYQAHFQGKKVYAWTANTESSIDSILYNHADGIVTDNVPLAWSRIRESGINRLLDELTDFFFPLE